MKTAVFTMFIGVSLLFASVVSAQMSSANYQINADAFTTGGGDDSSAVSGNYSLRGSGGNLSAGTSSSATYSLQTGFRAQVFDPIVTLDIAAQETAQVRNVTGLTGTVVSMSNTSIFSEGDYVILVQDESSTHNVGIGKVTSVSAGVSITLDSIETNAVLTMDGTDDFAYRANGSSLSYGTLSDSAITHRMIGWEATSDTPNGISVYVAENTDLTTGANTIADVADGAVTAGSAEYGARSSDTSLANSTFDTQDTGITSTPQEVATVAGTAFDAKGVLDVKAAISVASVDGTYAHNIYFIVAPTY